MTAQADGGPAFPGERIVWDAPNRPTKQIGRIPVPGMSLLDHFAGQAISGLLAMHCKDDLDEVAMEQIASNSYRIAIHMLNKKPE